MDSPPNSVNKAPSPSFLSCLCLVLVLVLFHAFVVTADNKPTNVGAIVDVSSRKGKEEKTAMEIAISRFNKDSKNLQLSLHFGNSTGEPIQSAFTGSSSLQHYLSISFLVMILVVYMDLIEFGCSSGTD